MPSSTDQPNFAVAAASPLDELPIGLEALREIALDLRWTWSHAGDDLWGAIDAETWALTRNPWLVLQMVPRARLDRLAGDGDFRRALDRVADDRRAQMGARATPASDGEAPRRRWRVWPSRQRRRGASPPGRVLQHGERARRRP